MRVLRFDREEHGEIYTMLAQAARFGEARGIEANRRVTKLLDKLDFIGESHVEPVRGPDGEPMEMTVWELVEEESTIVLDDALYEELKRRMDGVPWNANASPRVVAAYDFLEAAPEELDGVGDDGVRKSNRGPEKG